MEGESVAGIVMPEGDPGAVRDAAGQLRSVGRGFDSVAAAVGDAAASVPTWQGLAALQFSDQCTDYEGAATGSTDACEAAAGALDAYAEDLAQARQRVHAMQQQGKQLLEEERQARAAAEEAEGRMRGAQMNMKMAAMEAPVDGGAAMDSFRAQVDGAISDMSRESGRAERARGEIERLQREAQREREQVEQQGRAAANRVRGAADGLAAPPGGPGGSVGGTALSSRTEKFSMGITVIVVRLGGDKAVIKERTADGKWKVTTIDGVEGGLEFDPVPGAGVDGGAGSKMGRLGAGADVQAALLAQYKKGQVYEFPNETLADRFIEYEDKYVPDSPSQVTSPGGYMSPNSLSGFYIAKGYDRWQDRQRPVEVFSEGGVRATANADAGGVAGGSASAEEMLGTRRDTRTGVETNYLKTSGSLAGEVGAFGEAGGKVRGEAITAFSHDGDRPTSYSVTVSGNAEGMSGFAGSGGADVSDSDGASSRLGGGASHNESEGVRIERQVTLDLNDSANREAVERYMDSGGADPAATADLVERLRDDGRVDERVYNTGSSESGANIDTKIVKIDGSQATEEATLRSMRHHGPGGPFVETVP